MEVNILLSAYIEGDKKKNGVIRNLCYLCRYNGEIDKINLE